jgi:iron complex outermembrane receptor protein
VTTYSGGNPDLTPETSQSWNAGVVIEPRTGPIKGLRVSVDYYAIRKQNNIGSLSAQVMVENEALFPERVVRNPAAAGDRFGVGTIASLNLASMNLLKAFLEGFDINIGYRKDTQRFGNFTASFLSTIVNHSKRKTTFGQPYIDSTNFSGSSGGLKFSGNGTLSWDYRNWTASWTTRYYNAIRISAPPVTTSTAQVTAQGGPFIPAQSYSDLIVAYRFAGQRGASADWKNRMLRDTEIQFGVTNIFKKTPPYDVGSFGSYYYSTYGDIRWRDLRLSVKKAL